MCEANLLALGLITFHYTNSLLPSVDHAYGNQVILTRLKGNITPEGCQDGAERF